MITGVNAVLFDLDETIVDDFVGQMIGETMRIGQVEKVEPFLPRWTALAKAGLH